MSCGNFLPNRPKPILWIDSLIVNFWVICLTARGEKLKGIAVDLRLSAKIMESYKSKDMRKLELRNGAETYRFVYNNQLVENMVSHRDESRD